MQQKIKIHYNRNLQYPITKITKIMVNKYAVLASFILKNHCWHKNHKFLAKLKHNNSTQILLVMCQQF